jgi:hypothetical protein
MNRIAWRFGYVLPLTVLFFFGMPETAQAGWVSKCGYYWDYCYGYGYGYCGGKYGYCYTYGYRQCYTCKYVWEYGRGVGPFQRWKQERQLKRKSQQ